MCGICGILKNDIDRDESVSMLSAIKFRGPDDDGIFFADGIFLGHTRLSILDLSNAGHQPMMYKDFAIVFNGEIYNYVELKKELESLGHKFKTNSDTEVLLHCYDEWKEKTFTKLRGMWAFAIYDKVAKRLILSRDRFGIKPLYYFANKNQFLFASDIRCFFKIGVKAEANLETTLRYLALGIDDNGVDTFFNGIHQLPGSNFMIVNLDSNEYTINKYYSLEESVKKVSMDYEHTFLDAVQVHLRSDAKIGACLSGGLDSSTLAAIAKLNLSNEYELNVYTAKSEDNKNDETSFAEKVANHCNLKHNISFPTYDDFVKYNKYMIENQVEPVGSPSVFMQFWVMKEAHSHRIKVMLDGQGGDETLLGYERYYVCYLLSCLKNFNFIKFFVAYIDIVNNSKLNYFAVLKYLFYFGFTSVRKQYIKNKVHYIKQNLLNDFLERNLCYISQDVNLLKLQIKELTKTQLPHLLRYEDRNSMCFGIESRVPYLDHKLVEVALNLKMHKKIKNGYTKYCLREIAEKYLPESVAWRKNKFGFEAPEDLWLRQYQNEMQLAINKSNILKQLLSQSVELKRLTLREQWRLYNLAVWEDIYLNQ